MDTQLSRHLAARWILATLTSHSMEEQGTRLMELVDHQNFNSFHYLTLFVQLAIQPFQ